MVGQAFWLVQPALGHSSRVTGTWTNALVPSCLHVTGNNLQSSLRPGPPLHASHPPGVAMDLGLPIPVMQPQSFERFQIPYLEGEEEGGP